MKRVTTIVTTTAVLLTAALVSAWQPKRNAADERALNKLVEDWIVAHDKGDAQALAKFYARDADSVGIDGQVVKGRDAIMKMYAQVFTQNSGNKAKVSLSSRRFIKPDIVVDDGTWEVIGVLPEGSPTKGRYTSILRKQDGNWQVLCSRTMVPWRPQAAEAD